MIDSQSMIRQCRIHDAELCCLTTGMEPRTFAHSTVTDSLRDQGFRISADGTVQPFYLNETISFFDSEKAHEEIGIVLPVRDATPLISIAAAEHKSPSEAAAALRTVYRLLNTLVHAVKAGTISESLFHAIMSAPLCLLTEAAMQELIVLPPRLVQRCITGEARTALYYGYLWMHPDRDQAPLPDAADFLFAALGYACITATQPFSAAVDPFDNIIRKGAAGSTAVVNADTIDQLVQNIRDGAFVPIDVYCPAVTANLAALINGGLTIGKTQQRIHPPQYEQLCTYCDETLPIFTDANSDGDHSDLSGQSTELFVSRAAANLQQPELSAFIGKARKRITRRRFLLKNMGKIITAAAVCVMLTAAAFALVLHIRRPPKTAGLSPEAVVRGFYNAVESLDQEILSAYTKNKAGVEYEGLLVHLFVTAKIREAYEQKKIYYTPQEFIGLCETVRGAAPAETPMLKTAVIAGLNGGSIYGISGLSVMPAADAELFDVFFYYWVPLFSSETTDVLMNETQELSAGRTAFPIQVLRYHDQVRVIHVKDSFFIGAITPLERTILTESSDEVIAACTASPAQRPTYAQFD